MRSAGPAVIPGPENTVRRNHLQTGESDTRGGTLAQVPSGTGISHAGLATRIGKSSASRSARLAMGRTRISIGITMPTRYSRTGKLADCGDGLATGRERLLPLSKGAAHVTQTAIAGTASTVHLRLGAFLPG